MITLTKVTLIYLYLSLYFQLVNRIQIANDVYDDRNNEEYLQKVSSSLKLRYVNISHIKKSN